MVFIEMNISRIDKECLVRLVPVPAVRVCLLCFKHVF